MSQPTSLAPLSDPDHSTLHNFHVNAKMFNATGDGTTDDTTAVQAAINAAGTSGRQVFIPAGTYSITSTLTVPTNIEIRGSGMNTILKHNAGANPLISFATSAVSAGVRDMKLLAGTGTGNGIAFGDGVNYTLHNVIDNVRFEGIGDATHWAIRGRFALETYISRCDFVSCGGGGIYLSETSNASVIRDCKMSNGGFGALGGILIEADGCLIDGCVVEAWRGSYGVKAGGLPLVIHRTWFEDNYGNDIHCNAGTKTVIEGCNISDLGTGSYPNALYNDAGSGTEQTFILLSGTHIQGLIKFNNGASDILRVIMVGSTTGGSGSWSGDVNIDGITTAANFSLIRVGGIRDKLAAAGVPQAFLEAQGAGSGLRIEDSKIFFGTAADTATAGDTNLYRSAANVLKTDDKLLIADELELDGALNHDGTTVGFYGVTPATRPTAYTQTYATADKTHADFTSSDLATTAATQTTPWGFATQAQADAIATKVNALRVDVADLKQLVNSMIDDLQSLGILQ